MEDAHLRCLTGRAPSGSPGSGKACLGMACWDNWKGRLTGRVGKLVN